jgi:outer membrane protein assembly factor BamD
LAERETEIGLYYGAQENYPASVARLQTVVDTYPLYSKSDQALLGIGDAFAGQARHIQGLANIPPAIKERLHASYQDRAAEAYAKVITRYPMAPHVEDARDRLVAMNRPVPEPTDAAVAESDSEEKSRKRVEFVDKTFGIIKHGPSVVEAVHVGEPSLDDPKRTLAPDVTKQNAALVAAAINEGKPGTAPVGVVGATGVNEPPRSDQPSQAPLQLEKPGGGTGVGVQILSAPAADPNAVVKAVGPANTTIPAAEKPADAPDQVNDVKPGSNPTAGINPADAKKHKADLNDESSSKKKKKKGLAKLKPF